MKKNMKREIAVVGITCMLVVTMTGCSSNTNQTNPNNGEATPGVDVSEESDNSQVDNGESDTNQNDKGQNDKVLDSKIPHRYADAAEGIQLRMANTEYFDNMSQNNLDFRVGKNGATLEEFKKLAQEQIEDFTEEEMKVIDASVDRMQERFEEIGFKYPLSAEIVFIKSKMEDESGATAYTHKNQIYISGSTLDFMKDKPMLLDATMAHELFHVISRNDPDFRQAIYNVLGFTIADEPDFSPELRAKFGSNPDVEKFDSYATFTINGKPTKAVVVTLLDKSYREGLYLFDHMSAAIVPYDKPDTYYSVNEVSDFWEVFGRNTNYAITTEESIADNFCSAVIYGMEGRKYKNPEIIEDILEVMGNYEKKVK